MTSEESSILSIGPRRRGFVRWIFGGVLILLLIGIFVVPLIFFRGLARGYPVPGPYGYAGPYFFLPFGFLFFILIAFFVVRSLFWGWGWRRGGGYRGNWGYGEDAKEILKRRYARGEITKEQFDQMKKDIDEQT
ncbi:MAG: SHOCT domain-containing protein [Thaumarchaeota archaeon]|nr:SHOCT domain-containing protein [Nitrososphaerota archaeon]